MDFSTDELRREARETQVAHASAMRHMREIVARLFTGDHAAGAGAVDRRRFLQMSGLGVAGAAVLAACGNGGGSGSASETTTTEGTTGASDVTILRTASSLEVLAADVYQKAIDSGLVTTAAVLDAMKLFQAQHKEHAGLFQGATKKLGGKPFEKANAVVLAQLQPAIAGLKDEPSAVKLALDLENTAAATYVASTGTFDDATLNQAVMAVGGVEGRHVAVLAKVLGQPQLAKAFWTTDGAVAPGTGV
jgi:hypothetical protein